jgi:hypothetical protein
MNLAEMRFSRFEIVGALVIIAAFVAFSVVSFLSLDETKDAALVQAIHTQLQATISQAAARQHIPPTDLGTVNVINAIKTTVPSSVRLRDTGIATSPYEISFPASGRKAVFFITPEGDVRIRGLAGSWTRFSVVNGVIHKN